MNYIGESYDGLLKSLGIEVRDIMNARDWLLGAFDALDEEDAFRVHECLEEVAGALGLMMPTDVPKGKTTQLSDDVWKQGVARMKAQRGDV